MAELLLELLSEEIPARMQRRAGEDLSRLAGDGLKAAGLDFDDARAYVTPRRLVLVVDGLPERQPDVRDERKGPRVGAPEKAIQGFLRGAGLETIDQAEVRDGAKGAFYFAVVERVGRPTAEVLVEVLGAALGAMTWPKSMTWAPQGGRWVRPVRGLLCRFAGAVVPLCLGAVAAGDATSGHRFLAPKPFTVKDFADYQAKLRQAFVMLDWAERRAAIEAQARQLAAEAGLDLEHDPALLDEVAGLVEWPVAYIGTIDAQFMEVPPEVLTTAMRSHQKYFALLDADGALAPRFIVVANGEGADGGGAIVAGNQRVLRARLADAKFFWDLDRGRRLEDRVADLGGRVFHARLGSVLDKAGRLRRLAAELAAFVPGASAEACGRAAHLAKADLSCAMVGEFPELQGVMGRYYAAADGETPEVARAIAEHYAPQGPNDACPTAPVSMAAALADKIDSLVGFWIIDEKPTGSKDPFALRRAALGVIRLIVENRLRLPLTVAFAAAARLFAEARDAAPGAFDGADLMAFFADRLEVHLRQGGVRHDLISAVFALDGEDDLVRLLARVEALGAFLDTNDGADLLAAYKRAANIVQIEEKKDGVRYDTAVEEALLDQDEERTLFAGFAEVSAESAPAIEAEDFADAMSSLARLRAPVDAFFDHVTVNCDHAARRANRLRLLSQIRATMNSVADFSRIEG